MLDLGLSDGEEAMFRAMIGKRFNPGKREVRIVCDRFPNRIENKKYAIIQLERLIAESKRIYKMHIDERNQLRDAEKKKGMTALDKKSA